MASSIKISSISIDLAGATDEIGVGNCEHFSIRGFVSEIRQRDWKKCWPFSMNSELEGQSYPLPSLPIPKSRWWRCESCVRDINADEEINDHGGVKLLSVCQLHSNSKSLTENKLDSKAIVISPTDASKKERKADFSGNSISPDENEDVNHESCEKDDQIEELLKKARRGSMDASTVGSKNKKLVCSRQPKWKSKERASVSKEINRKENQEATNDQFAEALITFGSSDIAGVVDDTPEAMKNNQRGHGSVELDECDNVSSESAIFARNFLNHSPDSITGLNRRKTRKVRLLSELLSGSKTRTSNGIRNEESSRKRELARGRKRKSSGDEEWRPPAAMPQNSFVNRKLSKIGKNSGNASQSSDSEDNVLSGNGSQPSVESQSTDNGFDRDPIKGKKKNKRFQVVDEHLPAVSLEIPQKVAEKNDEGSPKQKPSESTFPSSVHASFAGKPLVPCRLHTQKTERKSSLAKRKNKKILIDNQKNTVFTVRNGMTEGNQRKVRKADALQTNYVNTSAQSQTKQDVSNRAALNPSLDKLFASEGYARKHILQPEDGPVFSLPWREIHQKDNHERSRDLETIHFPDFASPSKLNIDGCVRTGAYIDLSSNGNTNILPVLDEKLRHAPSAEVADHSLMLQKDTSGAHNKDKNLVIQEHSGTSKIQSDHKKEKTPEHLEDIPMEIVELMAKNQYERCLADREDNNNKQPSQATTSTSRNALLIDLNKTYENGLSLEDNTLKQPKPRSRNARKIDVSKGEYFLSERPTSMDFFPISQFGQAYVPSGLRILPFTRDNTSSSIQFSGGQCSHNCQWLGNMATMADQIPSPSSFQVLRACNTCQSVPQQYREASHPTWPSSMISQNQMPVSFSMPHNFTDQTAKLDKFSQAPSNDLSSWNLNFLNPGKQNRGFDSEYSFGCKHGRVSSRNLDPYSNESSIPAMHLLSLMDPRLRAQTVDLPGNTKFMKKPSISQVHQSKDFPGIQSGENDKVTNPIKQLPCDFYSKRLFPETSRENFAAIPAVGTSSFSFQNAKSFAKGVDFTAQASWKHPEKKVKKKDSVPVMYNSQNAILTSSNLEKFQLIGATSDSMMPPLKFHSTANNCKQKAKEQSNIATAWPSRPITCSVNRNPADFTIPEPGNVYMLKGEDLKVRKRASFKKKPSLCKQDALKQSNKPAGPATENA